MVALLGPGNILQRHALYMLHHDVQNSWFVQLRQTSVQYSLPDPLQVLASPPPKLLYKSSVKTAVFSYWHTTLVAQAAPLSLAYATFDLLSFLWAKVPIHSGGHVAPLPVLYVQQQSKPRCYLEGTDRVGFDGTGQTRVEPADCQAAVLCLVMWPTSSPPSVPP